MSSCSKSRLCGLVGVIIVAALLATAFSVTSQPPLGKTLTAADTAGQAKPAGDKQATAKPAPAARKIAPGQTGHRQLAAETRRAVQLRRGLFRTRRQSDRQRQGRPQVQVKTSTIC